jgi:RNA polymerase sigma-70 factor (ECF subfamily)
MVGGMAATALPDIDDPDADLLRRLRDGDAGAVADLVRRHQRRLTWLAWRDVRSAFVADEVVQETWIAFLDGLDRFEGRCRLGTWLDRIVRNKARAVRRREARAVSVDDIADRPGPDPTEAGLGPDERDHLIALLGTLPPLHRRVLVLCDLLDRPRPEVCATLGLSAGNQRVVLHRARRTVRAALERERAA